MTATTVNELNMSTLLHYLCERAVAGDRCPTQNELLRAGYTGTATPVALARAQRIRIEVYGRNWRVVEIREGEHKGKRTQEPPGGGKPYKVIYGQEPVL